MKGHSYSPPSILVLCAIGLGALALPWGNPALAAAGDVDPGSAPAAAEVGAPSYEEVALEAQRIHSEYCGSLQGTDRGLAGESFAVVGPVWGRVSKSYQEGGPIFLLYWSGLLSQCLGRNDDAVTDLRAFLASEESRPLVSMVADAGWRLKRRARGQTVGTSSRKGPRGPSPGVRRVVPTLLPGIGLAAGGAVLGGIAAAQWGALSETSSLPQVGAASSGMLRSELDTKIADFRAGQAQFQALAAVAAGLAASSLVSFVIAGAADQRARAKSRKQAQLYIAPGPGGLYLGVSASW